MQREGNTSSKEIANVRIVSPPNSNFFYHFRIFFKNSTYFNYLY